MLFGVMWISLVCFIALKEIVLEKCRDFEGFDIDGEHCAPEVREFRDFKLQYKLKAWLNNRSVPFTLFE